MIDNDEGNVVDSNSLKIKDVLEEILIGWKILSVIFVIFIRGAIGTMKLSWLTIFLCC